MSSLSDEIKNLGCRLGKTGPIDKKVERKIKEDLLKLFKQQCEECISGEQTEEAVVHSL